MKWRQIIEIGSAAAILGFAVTAMAQDVAPAAKPEAAKAGPAVEKKAEPKAQSLCPITGKAIDKNCYADVDGCRIYVCSKNCIDKVKADPKACIKKVADKGESCACVCGKCGCVMAPDPSGSAKTMQCQKCKAVQPVPACCKANPSCPVKEADAKATAPAPAAPVPAAPAATATETPVK